jgi:hypothetical protein
MRHRMPAYWLTINPFDLRNPLILLLAGVEYSRDVFLTANVVVCYAIITSNPVIVA